MKKFLIVLISFGLLPIADAVQRRYEYPSMGFHDHGNDFQNAPTPEAACERFSNKWWNEPYGYVLKPDLPGRWICQITYKGEDQPGSHTWILGLAQK